MTIWPQITMVALWGIGFGMNVVKHGEPKGNFSLWSSMIGIGLEGWILYSGGFFASLGWQP